MPFLSLHFVFKITNMAEYNEYSRQRKIWDVERQRRSEEFTITENDLHADLRMQSQEVNWVDL